jgi:hypothetical protein
MTAAGLSYAGIILYVTCKAFTVSRITMPPDQATQQALVCEVQ